MDPIADLLNQIKTSQAVFKPTAEASFSEIKMKICDILQKEGFIEKAEKKGKKVKKTIEITLKYNGKEPAISGLKRVSKSGQRIYKKADQLHSSMGNYGIAIVTTPRGVMTSKEARKQKVGGEVIAEIW